jgi:hypothetical protein
MDTPTKGRAEQLYGELQSRRQPFLDRARLCARYTIPALLPPEGTSGSSELYKPFQSIGSRGVNNLASKLVLTLLPPTRRFFRLLLTEKYQDQIPDEQRSEWELALSKVESRILERIETIGIRVNSFEAMRHLVVAGNVLVFTSKEGTRVFPLSQYVVRRTPNGKLRDIVIKECVTPEDLPDSVREVVLGELRAKDTKEKVVELFTHVYLDKKTMRVYQEVKGHEIPESRGSYGTKRCPWLPLRWTRIDGEDYGRSHCDDYLGDLIAAESLSRSIIRGSAIAAKVVFLVNPNGMTDPNDLEKAYEGQFVVGQQDDISTLGLEKFADFQVARATLEEIVGRLSYAFLLNSAIRRQGERVTAEEIRFMAAELEDGVGGAYSVLSIEFQLPIVEIVQALMERAGDLPSLPDKTVRPTIVTGIDALGRSHELARLDAFLGGALQTFGAEVLQFINVGEYLKRRAAGLDIEPKVLVRSDEEIAKQQQASATQSLAEKAAPAVVKAVSDQALAGQQATPTQ